MHKRAKSYLVEPGVVATLRGFTKGTGYGGRTMINLQIVKGTEHLFTPEVLGPTVVGADGEQVRTEWFAAETDERGHPLRSGCLIWTDNLPEEVVSRYRLYGDFVSVSFHSPGYFRAFPQETW